MKAIFTVNHADNAVNMGNKKETVSVYTVIGSYKGKMSEPVEVRVYMGRSSFASVVYASIWVNGYGSPKGSGISVSGRGSAGGWGYHKESAAIQDAINSAGIKLFGSAYTRRDEKEDLKKECSISGVGDSAIETALLAIGRALGYRVLHLTKR